MKDELKEIEENLGEDIYSSLVEIQEEQDIKLSDKAFITDFLSHKLVLLGYRKVETEC